VSLLEKAAGTATILRALPRQRRIPFLSRDELEQLRDLRVRETVSYAAEHVPFYRDVFRSAGISPREIRRADDLGRLPLISREQVLRDPTRFRSDAREARDGVTLRSSGTTGVSLRLFHDRRSVLLNISYSERERAVESAFVGKRFRYTRLFLAPEAVENVRRVRGLAAERSFRPFRPRYHVEPFQRPREELLAAIERIRPDVLMGSGSVLEVFFRLAAGGGAPRHLPRVVLYGWDPMTAYGRELIEQTFGIPVLSRYSAMECLKIGYFCELRRGFHLHEDLCHVQARGPDGLPVMAGEPAELVLSNLINRGTVLLNYRLGDRGALSDAPCPCGRNTRVLLELDGRVDDAIALPDGGIVGAMGISAAVGAVPGILRFRLVQRGATKFDLELSLLEDADFEPTAEQAVAALRSALRACEIRPVHRQDIALATGGKHRLVVPLRSAE
jgi:phenylacetate-coenzyme A ligase PaaK-like adenylate-forming protein